MKLPRKVRIALAACETEEERKTLLQSYIARRKRIMEPEFHKHDWERYDEYKEVVSSVLSDIKGAGSCGSYYTEPSEYPSSSLLSPSEVIHGEAMKKWKPKFSTVNYHKTTKAKGAR